MLADRRSKNKKKIVDKSPAAGPNSFHQYDSVIQSNAGLRVILWDPRAFNWRPHQKIRFTWKVHCRDWQ